MTTAECNQVVIDATMYLDLLKINLPLPSLYNIFHSKNMNPRILDHYSVKCYITLHAYYVQTNKKQYSATRMK